MLVIPVADLRDGAIVHAQQGERAAYRPIVSPLARDAEPLSVVSALLGIGAFPVLYVADLDGIAQLGPDLKTVAELVHAFPGLKIWVDNGAATPTEVERLLAIGGTRAVVGSETLGDVAELKTIQSRFSDRIVVSLDFKGSDFCGPEQLLAESWRWSPTVIAMTLASVGSRAGPDLHRVRWLKSQSPQTRVIAAGGVRDKADLVALASAGAAGVLVATALHSGTLKAGDLDEVAGLGEYF